MSDDLTTYAGEFSDTVSVGVAERGLRAGFTPVTNEWLDREDVTGEAKLIYAIFCRMAWQVGHCTPDVKLFHKLTGFGEKSIRKAIAELVELGAVSIKRRGQGKSNFYSVRLIFQNGQKDVSRSGTLDSESQNGQKDVSRTVRKSDLERPKGGTTYTGGKTKGRPVLSPPGSVSNQLELSDPKEDISPVRASRSLSPLADDMFSPSKAAGRSSDPRPFEVFTYYQLKIQPSARLEARNQIHARLKKWTVEQLKQAIDNFAADQWWMDNNGRRGAEWFFKTDARIEQLVNLNDPNHVRGTQGKGKDNAAAIRDNGYNPRAVRLTAQQRANAEDLAARYPNLKG